MRAKWREITESLLNRELGKVFKDPVDPVEDDLPDYYQIVKNPIDLTTVLTRVNSGYYRSTAEWIAEVNRVFDNAILYNGNDSYTTDVARVMKQIFERLLDKASLTGYEGWCRLVDHHYTKLAEYMAAAPPAVNKAISGAKEAGVTVSLSEEQLVTLAGSLGTMNDKDEIAKVCQLLSMYGADIPLKAKRGQVNVRALPAMAQLMLWNYAREAGKIKGL